MKKSIFLLGVAVAAMTSCSNDKLLDQAEPIQRAIGFDSFVNKTTKAVTATNESIEKFYAFGYYTASEEASSKTEIFDNGNIAVTKPAEGDVWNYDNTEYWTKNYYHFAGYANGNNASALEANFTDHSLSITDYTVSDANDLVADVLEIDNTNFAAYATKVAFDFKHLLTKIQFKVINTDNTYKMKITKPLQITGIKTSGDVVYSETENGWTADWTATDGSRDIENAVVNPTNDAGNVVYIPTLTTNQTDAQIQSTEYLVMPQAVESIEYSITVEFYDENNSIVSEKSLSGSINVSGDEAFEWTPGYAYLYTISLPTAVKEIQFTTPTFTGWDQTNVATPIELNTGDNGENGMTSNTPNNPTQG